MRTSGDEITSMASIYKTGDYYWFSSRLWSENTWKTCLKCPLYGCEKY
jgi:hypothetical protein